MEIWLGLIWFCQVVNTVCLSVTTSDKFKEASHKINKRNVNNYLEDSMVWLYLFDDWKLHWNMNSSHIVIVQYKATKSCSWGVLKTALCAFFFLVWLYLLGVDPLLDYRVKNMTDQKSRIEVLEFKVRLDG